MSGKDISVTSLKERDVDLKITLQGTTLKIELPLSPTGRPSEMPFAAVDQQKKEDYLTKAENRLTGYLVGNAGIGGFNVDKVSGSGKGEGNISAVKVEFSSTAEANRVFADKGFINSLQANFDQDRKREHMDAAAAWTQGIGGAGARIPYNGVVLKVDDKTAFQYYTRNFDEKTCPAEKQGEHFMLKMLMDARYGNGFSKKLSSAGGIESPAQEPSDKTLVASAALATQNSDGSRSQIEKQNSQAAADIMPSPTTVTGNAKVVDSASPAIDTQGAQSLEFKNNPTVQQVSAALERNGIAADQNPSLVAGLAGAAANLSKVQDVALTPQTAFALDRDKFDPAANRASVNMDVANKPFDEVWQKASVALQQTQAPAVVAQAQDLEQKQSQSAPRM